MSKNIIAFGASSSIHSINKKFANYAAQNIADAKVNLLDLNDFEMSIYSIDKEKATGIPELATKFRSLLLEADGIIISFAEHNGAYSAAFKNIMDWISRIEGSIFGDKPMLLLSTSPGGRGGKTVLGIATTSFPHMNKNTIASFSLPYFNKNFSEEKGILDADLLSGFNQQKELFEKAL